MKKFMILLSAFSVCSAVNAADFGVPASTINAIQTFQGTYVHDMDSINQQRFRYEEINELKDIQEQKDKKNAEIENVLNDETNNTKKIKSISRQQDVQFTEENGEIKILNSPKE